MILDTLENAPSYYGLGCGVRKAFEFLLSRDLRALDDGHDGDERGDAHRQTEHRQRGAQLMGAQRIQTLREIVPKPQHPPSCIRRTHMLIMLARPDGVFAGLDPFGLAAQLDLRHELGDRRADVQRGIDCQRDDRDAANLSAASRNRDPGR